MLGGRSFSLLPFIFFYFSKFDAIKKKKKKKLPKNDLKKKIFFFLSIVEQKKSKKKRIGTSLINSRTLFLFVRNRKQDYKVKGANVMLPQFSLICKTYMSSRWEKKKKKKEEAKGKTKATICSESFFVVGILDKSPHFHCSFPFFIACRLFFFNFL